MDGKFGENNELYPDIEVYNTPEDYLNGNDNQLKAAIKEMLKEADAVKNK
jgi:C-terminal processing protease CtpA/Prc